MCLLRNEVPLTWAGGTNPPSCGVDQGVLGLAGQLETQHGLNTAGAGSASSSPAAWDGSLLADLAPCGCGGTRASWSRPGQLTLLGSVLSAAGAGVPVSCTCVCLSPAMPVTQ